MKWQGKTNLKTSDKVNFVPLQLCIISNTISSKLPAF